jgi:hypothetical protein
LKSQKNWNSERILSSEKFETNFLYLSSFYESSGSFSESTVYSGGSGGFSESAAYRGGSGGFSESIVYPGGSRDFVRSAVYLGGSRSFSETAIFVIQKPLGVVNNSTSRDESAGSQGGVSTGGWIGIGVGIAALIVIAIIVLSVIMSSRDVNEAEEIKEPLELEMDREEGFHEEANFLESQLNPVMSSDIFDMSDAPISTIDYTKE